MVLEEEREEEEEEIVLQKRGARPLSETDFPEEEEKKGWSVSLSVKRYSVQQLVRRPLKTKQKYLSRLFREGLEYLLYLSIWPLCLLFPFIACQYMYRWVNNA